MVKVGGKRFSSLEVEQALRDMPGVAEAAVVVFERFGEQAIGAFVRVDAGAVVSEEAVRAHLAARLAPFKLPRALRLVDALPRASHDKIDYAALRAFFTQGEPGTRRDC
jgi:acyl-coenzyme A synthetase/AMP-(fatty) acid ligase